jgi:uncharacterized RDD family membrane protein YckC
MIRPTMAVASAVASRSEIAEYARDARWARFAALVLDAIFLSLVYAIVNSVYGVTVVTSGYIGDNGGLYTTTTAVPWPWLSLIGFVYFIVLEAMFGATLGKQLMRVKVVRLDGQDLSVTAVAARNVLRIIDFLPIAYLLGGLLVLATPAAQRVGDMVAGTAIVYRHRARRPGATRTSDRRKIRILVLGLASLAVFTVGFDYFGRPPLVIQGMYNQRLLPNRDTTAYSLGSPSWGWGEVTYPMKYAVPTQICSGSITLQWQWFDWQWTDATGYCPLS